MLEYFIVKNYGVLMKQRDAREVYGRVLRGEFGVYYAVFVERDWTGNPLGIIYKSKKVSRLFPSLLIRLKLIARDLGVHQSIHCSVYIRKSESCFSSKHLLTKPLHVLHYVALSDK